MLAGTEHDIVAALTSIGDVHRDPGDLTAAREAYKEALAIRRSLIARDPGHAGWARDLWVSLWRMAEIDGSSAKAHWTAVALQMEEMAKRGTLSLLDVPYLDADRQNLKALTVGPERWVCHSKR